MLGNWFKTGLLMAAIVALFGTVGALLGGGQGVLLALALALGINFWAYWFSDTMVLKLYRAQEVDARTAPQFYGEVQERAGLPMPRVYLIDKAQPNAFATGRNPEHAAIAATTGILQLLTPSELRGVLGHELTHMHRDILTSTITASLAGTISTLAQFGLFFGGAFGKSDDDNRNPPIALLVLILAPIAAMLIQLAISRSREYETDRGGAEVSADPRALADALAKIDRYAKGLTIEAAETHPATAQMMMINPLSGGGLSGLFSTHPPTEERIHRLLAMAA